MAYPVSMTRMRVRHAHKTRLLLALLMATLLSGCAAASTPAGPTPGPEPIAQPSPEPPTPEPSGCDLTGSLQVWARLENHHVNDVGTKECDYMVSIRNAHPSETIVPVVFQREMESFKGTDETRWQALPPLAPGERYEWQGFVYLINDARASVPMGRIPKSLVALKRDAACEALQADAAYLHVRAVVVDEPCSPDLLLWPEFRTHGTPGG